MSTNGKTEVNPSNNRVGAASQMNGARVTDNTILLITRDNTGALSDGILNETIVEVIVWTV